MVVIADRCFVLPWDPTPPPQTQTPQLESALYIAPFRKNLARSEGRVLGLSALILRDHPKGTSHSGGRRALGGFVGKGRRFASCCGRGLRRKKRGLYQPEKEPSIATKGGQVAPVMF